MNGKEALGLKKILFVLTIFLVFLLSPLCFAKCELDQTRWEWIVSTDDYGVFLDTQTVKNFDNSAEVWICWYLPSSCEFHKSIGEHYHYNLFSINYRNNTYGLKSYINRDSIGRVTDSHTFSSVRYEPIPPDSVAEMFAMVAKKKIYNQ